MPSKKAGTAKNEAAESRSPSKRAAEPTEEAHAAEEGAPAKRRKGLGVRVIGGRIYDSENGKTCHQCRQKTIDFMASCKATIGSRPCTQHFCAKCLFNRYGEKVTEVAELPSWSCPRCRGDCNCSICLKKQGCVPTGILAHTAKATGFTSVAELLIKRPAVKADSVEALVSSPPKEAQKNGSTKDESIHAKSPTPVEKSGTPKKASANGANSNSKKRKLVVTADGGVEGPVANVLLRTSSPAKQKKAPADSPQDGLSPSMIKKAAISGRPNSNGKKEKTSAPKGTLTEFLLVKPKKTVTFGGSSELRPIVSSQNDQQVKREDGQFKPIKSKKAKSEKKSSVCTSSEDIRPFVSKNNSKVSKKSLKEESKVKVEPGSEAADAVGKVGPKKAAKKKDKNSGLLPLKNCKTEAKEPKKRTNPGKSALSVKEEEIVLPRGELLKVVAGLDFPSEVIGPAAQLVEFCSAFQSVLGLRKGDAEAMLRELTKGRLVRKGPNSLLVQLHAKLLNLIESSRTESSGHVTQFSSGKRSWLNVLKNHLREKSCMFLGLSVEDNAGSIQSNNVQPSAATVIIKDDLTMIKDAIEGGAEGYESLGVYHKLQLLVILCDDSLESQDMRDHMESVNREYSEAQRGSKEEVLAARKEVRDAKQKIKDAEVSKYLASGDVNGPLTAEDKEALLSKVLAETERAVAAASMEKEAVSRMRKGRSDAVRTDAIAWGPDGQAFYKLKGVDNMNSVVVQECKVCCPPGLDCWRLYSSMEEEVLTKFLLQRARICRRKMLAEPALEASRVKEGDEEKENRMPNSVSVKVEPVF